MLNLSLSKFKSQYLRKKNQSIYYSIRTSGEKEIENLINNFLVEKDSFCFESVEKGFIKGRYTIFGKKPDKVWEFNNSNCKLFNKDKVIQLKGTPKENIEKIIEEFNFDIPKGLPPISSILSGYFSYDIIRYIEKIPNSTKNDLNIPDSRILRPKNIIVHDNYEKKLFFIVNIFKDEKIKNFKKKFSEINNQIEEMVFLSNYSSSFVEKNIKKLIKIKSNISKKNL
tara:strand:- start:173 stop:850 length:678 start_codon:yes stop_codon:yes gene_type:complete